MLGRLPIESTQPVVVFAVVRLALLVVAVIALLVLGFPYEGRMLGVLGGLGLPWAAGVLLLARQRPEAALNPLIAAGDFALIVGLELAVPESYGAVRFTGLFLIAVHAHFQGERWGLAVAVGGASALIVAAAVREGGPVGGEMLAFYESVFAAAGLASALLVGRLRTTESASRLQARSLSRRTIQAETEVRRRVAESIHDGPVQELIGLGMVLSALGKASDSGDGARVKELVTEARELTTRNVRMLRDEIVSLGPYAFEELAFSTAVENCIETWNRRYGIEVMATLEDIEMPAEVAADLYRIVQEAVANAGRHAEARAVSISLRSVNGDVELRVTDDGKGFRDKDPLAHPEPGHLGIASMRERTELLDGDLRIESSEKGTKVVVRAPLPR